MKTIKWKPVVGYEGLYEISNNGMVKSLPKKAGKGSGYLTKERILKNGKYQEGYEYVQLMKNKEGKKHKIHRLVAFSFIPNPENKPQVNHINGIKNDNRVKNLEWCTKEENMQHAYKIGLQKPKKGRSNVLSKPIIQYDMNGNEVARYGSIREAVREFGGHLGDYCKHLKGRKKHYKGFIWKYE